MTDRMGAFERTEMNNAIAENGKLKRQAKSMEEDNKRMKSALIKEAAFVAVESLDISDDSQAERLRQSVLRMKHAAMPQKGNKK